MLYREIRDNNATQVVTLIRRGTGSGFAGSLEPFDFDRTLTDGKVL